MSAGENNNTTTLTARAWHFLLNENHRGALSLIGGAVVALLSGGWFLYNHLTTEDLDAALSQTTTVEKAQPKLLDKSPRNELQDFLVSLPAGTKVVVMVEHPQPSESDDEPDATELKRREAMQSRLETEILEDSELIIIRKSELGPLQTESAVKVIDASTKGAFDYALIYAETDPPYVRIFNATTGGYVYAAPLGEDLTR